MTALHLKRSERSSTRFLFNLLPSSQNKNVRIGKERFPQNGGEFSLVSQSVNAVSPNAGRSAPVRVHSFKLKINFSTLSSSPGGSIHPHKLIKVSRLSTSLRVALCAVTVIEDRETSPDPEGRCEGATGSGCWGQPRMDGRATHGRPSPRGRRGASQGPLRGPGASPGFRDMRWPTQGEPASARRAAASLVRDARGRRGSVDGEQREPSRWRRGHFQS